MKNKILIILLFVFFALAIPVAILGSLITSLWLFASVIKKAFYLEIIMAVLGIVIGVTYIVTYIFSLYKTYERKKLSIKSFFPAFHCILALLYLLSLDPAARYISNSQEYFGFAKKDFTVVEELDTHGGFHGDGSYYLILDCSDDREEALEKVKKWKKLPMSENLNLIIYGGENDSGTYRSGLADKAHIPKIENGYYIFEDRHLESNDSTDDTELFERGSYNFSLAVYDCDTDKMYYFVYDT